MSGSAADVLVRSSGARFAQDVLDVDGPVLVEFVARWCGSCRRFAPTVEALAREYAGRVRVVQVDADEDPELVRRYEVSSTPTLVLFTGGKPGERLVGAQPAAAVRELLDPALLQWAPGEACTLPTAEQPLREAEFDQLFATAVHEVQRPEPGRLRLHLDAAAGERARDLVARESSCCSFFDFRFTDEAGRLVLDVRVPQERVPVLEGMARQAESARERAAGATA